MLKCTLIVCPTILIDVWIAEIEKHCHKNTISYKIIQGPAEMRRLKKIATHEFTQECNQFDILITNFETLRNLVPLFQQTKFLRMVIDEAHYVRNQKTYGFKKMETIDAFFYLCMTGSPISNNMSDLHSLFCLMKSNIFSNPYIWKIYIESENEDAKKYKTLMSNEYILRRKKDILQLPKCTIKYEYVEFNPIESCIYNYIWDKTKQELSEKELEILMSDDILSKMNLNMLEKLLRVRQCCDNFTLLKVKKKDVKLKNELKLLQNSLYPKKEISPESPPLLLQQLLPTTSSSLETLTALAVLEKATTSLTPFDKSCDNNNNNNNNNTLKIKSAKDISLTISPTIIPMEKKRKMTLVTNREEQKGEMGDKIEENKIEMEKTTKSPSGASILGYLSL